MKKATYILLILFMAGFVMKAQETLNDEVPLGMVKYGPGYQFQDGIYLGFEAVKAGHPISPASIVSDLSITDRAFYEKVTAGKSIVIYDENGVQKELATNDLWGYSRNGILYIRVAESFHRISYLGSICHFVANITTYNPSYYDPYYYNPYYPGSSASYRGGSHSSGYSNSELRQYLLDFESGDVLEYSTASVGAMLMKDPLLADEFSALRNRKKKQMKFVFIRRYCLNSELE